MGDELRRASAVRRAAQPLFALIFRTFWRFEVEGLEHLPETGGVIVAGAPHLSYFDVVMAVGAGYKRVLLALTKAEAYDKPGLGWFLRAAGTIKLDRKGGDISGLRSAIDALKAGGCIGMFPEGTRSKTGEPGRAKQGTGFLASRAGVPVVPMRIFGMREFPFTRLKVRFGPAMRLEDPEADRAACLAFSEAVLARALSL